MSEGKATRFYVHETWHAWNQSQRYSVCDCDGSGLDHVVDSFRSKCAAEYAARILNLGVARVDSHALVGCRVVAS